MPGNSTTRAFGPRCGHLLRRRLEQQVGLRAAQHERRTLDRLPHRPQVHAEQEVAAELEPAVVAAPERADDARVVGEAPGAVVVLARAVARDVAPLRVVERTERCACDAQMTLDLRQILESHVEPGVHVLQPHEPRPGHERTDVVQHQASDRRAGLRRHHHADQPAHRRADPVDPLRASGVPQHPREVVEHSAGMGEDVREQRRGVGLIESEAVVGLVREPVARAASGDVDADDAAVGGEPRREIVEVAAVAREPVDADHRVRVVRAAPLGVGHAVETARPEAGEGPETGVCHEGRRRSRTLGDRGFWAPCVTAASATDEE